MLELNKLYTIKCEEGLLLLDDNSIDLIITSPPYNVNLGNENNNNKTYDIYNDNKDYNQYINWLVSIFKECYRVLKKGGRLCINIGDMNNGKFPTHSLLTYRLINELNYLSYTTIIWNKKHTSCRTAWGSYMKPSAPSFPQTFEYIIIFAKENLKLKEKRESDLKDFEFIKWSNPMWEINPETKQKFINHPAIFPEEIPLRLMKLFSYKNSIILDIFSGSGTTCKVAKENNRNWIGFDISENYNRIAYNRIYNIPKKLF